MNKTLLICKVVGTKFYPGIKNLPFFQTGYPVLLIREPENKFDPFAVAVWNIDQTFKLGHIPKKDLGYAQIISVLLENSISLSAVVIRCEPSTIDPVSIQISLA